MQAISHAEVKLYVWILKNSNRLIFFQAFSSIQTKQDSNSRELLAILYGLKSFISFIQGKPVKVYTDNANAHIIARKGSTSLRLRDFALQNFQFCLLHYIYIEVAWVVRSMNEFADSMSRIIDYSD